MILWIFDRSGGYTCEAFDIHIQPELFTLALATYFIRPKSGIGIDTFIQHDGLGAHITLNTDDKADKKFYLENEPFYTKA